MDYVFKIVVIGDSAVGKSQLLTRFSKNEFRSDNRSTVGVEFQTKTIVIDNKLVKAQIWDTAGQERYRAITTAYYRGALIVFDITSSESFDHATKWLSMLRDHADPNAVLMLVGNRCDLESIRAVPVEAGSELAEKEGLLFLETSAFLTVLERIYGTVSRKSLDGGGREPPFVIKSSLTGVKLDVKEQKQRYGCCAE